MKASDLVLMVVILGVAMAGGSWAVHSFPWFGMILGLSLGLPVSLFIVFLRMLCRMDICPLSVEVSDLTGDKDEGGEVGNSCACNKIRSLSQGL
jgi:hypothetical protein